MRAGFLHVIDVFDDSEATVATVNNNTVLLVNPVTRSWNHDHGSRFVEGASGSFGTRVEDVARWLVFSISRPWKVWLVVDGRTSLAW